METNNNSAAAVDIYKLAPGDLDHLYIKSGLVGNKLSSFRYNAKQTTANKPSPWFTSLEGNPAFASIARLLLEPDLKIHYHSGGSAAMDEEFFTFLSSADPHVLALFINSQGHYILLYFPDWQAYLQWWASVYSTEGSEDYEQISSTDSEIETLVCALHCIDFYRRSYMESMLDFRSQLNVSIHTHDFIQLLKNALASTDTRWLLPSLFELTPGLKHMSIALKPEHLSIIENIKFVQCNEDLILTLEERSMAMGTEFLMTWMGAVGWQASALINDEISPLSHVFMAPTAFANHLFSFETDPDGASRFRHQACNRSDLSKVLFTWMDTLREATADSVVKTDQDLVQDNICSLCGSQNRPGKKYCTSCGVLMSAGERGENTNE